MSDSLTEQIARLRDYEKQVLQYMAQVSQQHVAMQELDYDADPRVLRPYLDVWLDWHLGAAFWVTHAKQMLHEARAAHKAAWRHAVANTRMVEMESKIQYAGSFEERRVVYEMKTSETGQLVESLEAIIETVTSFTWQLRTALDHWDKRRVDTKWELDRMSRLPGSDYVT